MEKVALTAERDVLRAEVEALQDRLEMRHAFDGSGKRISVEPGSIPDGIACRDETIRQLDKRVDEYRAQVEAMREALAPFADVADLIDCETEGFGDDDIATLHLSGYEAARWRIGIFRTARAALAKPTGSPDDP
ncbi:hypothetical protein ACFONL_16065 [Camelimonas fluminis]|uniref:Uncharacterized protein n=1 Tax=Camelimonas fluminis TaxID=1576911 RepID=A0ABV7UJZ8_9HYPH|nr:hypothetical protein [Camelimonas fluminis]